MRQRSLSRYDFSVSQYDMCQFLAEPKKGGGVLIASLSDEEKQQMMTASEHASSGLLFNSGLQDFRSLFYDNDW